LDQHVSLSTGANALIDDDLLNNHNSHYDLPNKSNKLSQSTSFLPGK
jgi:hypothetical protein